LEISRQICITRSDQWRIEGDLSFCFKNKWGDAATLKDRNLEEHMGLNVTKTLIKSKLLQFYYTSQTPPWLLHCHWLTADIVTRKLKQPLPTALIFGATDTFTTKVNNPLSPTFNSNTTKKLFILWGFYITSAKYFVGVIKSATLLGSHKLSVGVLKDLWHHAFKLGRFFEEV
jgi:hypothetical protein